VTGCWAVDGGGSDYETTLYYETNSGGGFVFSNCRLQSGGGGSRITCFEMYRAIYPGTGLSSRLTPFAEGIAPGNRVDRFILESRGVPDLREVCEHPEKQSINVSQIHLANGSDLEKPHLWSLAKCAAKHFDKGTRLTITNLESRLFDRVP
jgi:hypothetical protein